MRPEASKKIGRGKEIRSMKAISLREVDLNVPGAVGSMGANAGRRWVLVPGVVARTI